MRKQLHMAVVLIVASVVVAAASGQYPTRPVNADVLFLLMQKPVQADLKLSDGQLKEATKLTKKVRAAISKGARDRDLSDEDKAKKREEIAMEIDKALGELLKADQSKRLKELRLQLLTLRALSDKDVVEALKLTGEQSGKIEAIREVYRKELRELVAGPESEENEKKMDELSKSSVEKALGVLNDDQKKKWKAMTGEPFKK